MKKIFVILLMLTELALYTNAQVYINVGSNLSKVQTSHFGKENDIYGIGYKVGLTYKFNLWKNISSNTGILFVNRKDPRYSALRDSKYEMRTGSDWIKQTQNIICVPIDLRVNIYKKCYLITGVDFNFFIRDTDTDWKDSIDPNFKIGASYQKDRWIFDMGYSHSIQPYAKNGLIDFSNKSFFAILRFQVFKK